MIHRVFNRSSLEGSAELSRRRGNTKIKELCMTQKIYPEVQYGNTVHLYSIIILYLKSLKILHFDWAVHPIIENPTL